jgi:hypothetical protein
MSPTVKRVLDLLEGVTRSKGQWMALCPGHEDTKPSLSLGPASRLGREARTASPASVQEAVSSSTQSSRIVAREE